MRLADHWLGHPPVSRFSFQFWLVKSDMMFEVTLGQVLIVNPRGDFRTPYFAAVEDIQFQTSFGKLVCALISRGGLLEIPSIVVRELTIFF